MSNNDKMTIKIKKYSFWETMFFLLGLSTATNVINVFQIGNVPVSIAQFLVFIMTMVLFSKGIRLICFIKSLKTSFKMWLVLVPLSIVLVLGSGMSNLISTYFAGIIELISVLLTIILISNRPYNIKNLLSGMTVGLLVNTLITLLAYIKWKITGSSINFGEIFNLTSYAYYGDYWRFRAQGLFTESSYYVCFICVTLPIALILHPVKKLNNSLLLFLAVTSVVLSLSGNILIFMIELLICFGVMSINTEDRNRYGKILLGILGILSILFIVLIFGKNVSFINEILAKISEGLQGANLGDAGNSARTENMLVAFQVYKENLFGYGYNMGAAVMKYKTVMHTGASSTFLRMFLDLGFIGGFLYIIMFYQYCIKNLMGDRKRIYNRTIGISMIGLFACQVANGYPFASVLTMVLLGVASINPIQFEN